MSRLSCPPSPTGRGSPTPGAEPRVSAEAASARAADLLEAGEFAGAARAFEQAAEVHGDTGDTLNESHMWRFAATMWRLAGESEKAVERAERALDLAAPSTPPFIAALAELGESALAAGDGARAADAYEQALEEETPDGPPVGVQAALQRRLAVALQHSDREDEAAEALRRAQALHREAGDPDGALAARVEEASLLQGMGDREGAARVADSARTAAEASNDQRALANLELLAAARAVDEQREGDALTAARSAREHALAAQDAVLYTGAAIAEAEMAEAAGDRVAAYGSLAGGLLGSGELLGPQAARMAFEPRLEALRERWGAAEFEEVREAYEAALADDGAEE
jgi:tetratricopeptide (TPR) repeat protein